MSTNPGTPITTPAHGSYAADVTNQQEGARKILFGMEMGTLSVKIAMIEIIWHNCADQMPPDDDSEISIKHISVCGEVILTPANEIYYDINPKKIIKLGMGTLHTRKMEGVEQMKYYLIGFLVLMSATGLVAIWGFIDFRWFFTVVVSGVVIFLSLDIVKTE